MSSSEQRNLQKYLRDTSLALILLLLMVLGLWAPGLMVPTIECHAEVHDCNGVLTNKTCEELAKAKPIPTRSIEGREESVLRGKKKGLLHDLRTKLLNERRSVGVDLDISEAEEVCNSPSTSLPECRKVVSSLDEKLESRITSARLVKSSEENKKAPTAAPAVVSNNGAQNQVIIVQQVAATPTPLLVYDLGGLIPVDRRPARKPKVSGDVRYDHSPEPTVPRDPGVTGGTIDISSAPSRPAKKSKGKE